MIRSVAAAKATLSELIRAAQDHQEVVITDHGRPVARIVPFEATRDTLDDRLHSFRERGLLLQATTRSEAAWPPATPVRGALARFLEERD